MSYHSNPRPAQDRIEVPRDFFVQAPHLPELTVLQPSPAAVGQVTQMAARVRLQERDGRRRVDGASGFDPDARFGHGAEFFRGMQSSGFAEGIFLEAPDHGVDVSEEWR